VEELTKVAGSVTELAYALDTFYFLMSGALVMWMAAGFAMLEAGLVRSKSTVEILTKNITLFAVACIMYMLMGYAIMYPGDAGAGKIMPILGSILGKADNEAAYTASLDTTAAVSVRTERDQRLSETDFYALPVLMKWGE